MTGLKHIEATLNYLLDTGEKPVYYLYPPPPGTPQRTGQSIKHTLPIHDGRARFTAHTGFDDPTTPADAPARESIEARMLVFFGPESKAQG